MVAISRVRLLFGAFLLLLAVVLFPSGMTAHHSWGKYHWFRTTTVLSLEVGDNLSDGWGGHLDAAVRDWNGSDRSESDRRERRQQSGELSADCGTH